MNKRLQNSLNAAFHCPGIKMLNTMEKSKSAIAKKDLMKMSEQCCSHVTKQKFLTVLPFLSKMLFLPVLSKL